MDTDLLLPVLFLGMSLGVGACKYQRRKTRLQAMTISVFLMVLVIIIQLSKQYL